jgi:hypothetical protein
MTRRVVDALKSAGAVLKRRKKHLVYELPTGQNVVVSSTPSDPAPRTTPSARSVKRPERPGRRPRRWASAASASISRAGRESRGRLRRPRWPPSSARRASWNGRRRRGSTSSDATLCLWLMNWRLRKISRPMHSPSLREHRTNSRGLRERAGIASAGGWGWSNEPRPPSALDRRLVLSGIRHSQGPTEAHGERSPSRRGCTASALPSRSWRAPEACAGHGG